MTMWLWSHGAGVIKASDAKLFDIAVNEKEHVADVQPTSANHLEGTVLFPLPSLPRDFSHLTKVAVDFRSHAASVVSVALWSGLHEVFQQTELEEKNEFKVTIYSHANIRDSAQGLVLAVGVRFDEIPAYLKFLSVGLEVAVAPPHPVESIHTGCWSPMEIQDVRRTQHSEKNEERIVFPTPFNSPPRVVVSLSGADVGHHSHFRVKVYATDVTTHGFTIHADSWGATKLYWFAVSWIAIKA